MRTAPSLARRAVGELPLLVVAVLLVSTGADVLPPDTLLAAGPVELDLSRILILAGLAALVYTHGARRELFASGLAIPLGLLVLAGLVATIKWGTEPRFRFLLEMVALLYLTLGVVRTRPESRTALALVALVVVSLSALDGVAQVAQDEATGFYRDGCTPVTAAPPLIPDDTFTRAIGSFANPNLLAAHILLLAPLGAAALVLVPGGWTLRRVLALVLGLVAVGLVLTYSRSGIVLGVLGAGASVWLAGARHRGYLAGVVAALAVVAFVVLGNCGSQGAAGFGRTDEWRETIHVIGDNPVTGVGIGRLGDVLNARDARSTSQHAHNLLLNWWAEAGPLALLAWLWLFAALVWRSLRAALAGDAVARGIVVALAAFFAYSMLDHPANVDRIAIALFVSMGVAAALPRARGGARA
jgi:O-antigen ligase